MRMEIIREKERKEREKGKSSVGRSLSSAGLPVLLPTLRSPSSSLSDT